MEAEVIARAFRDEYNDIRPHSRLNYQVPSEVRAELLKLAPASGQYGISLEFTIGDRRVIG